MSDSATKKILLVEGDPDLRQMLATVLSSRSRDVTSAGSAREFRDLQNADRFDLAVLDLNLPDDSGFAIVRFLRQSSPARIIVHTRRDTLTDRVEAYTQGADIYMVKPTPEAELLAAVDSLLKRGGAQARADVSGWRLDQAGVLIAPAGERVNLNNRQIAFMKCLMSAPGKPVARGDLRHAIGIVETDESGRALDMFVRRLRTSIETQTGQRGPIKTIYRLGFAFDSPSIEP
jgi:two-component system, OmpR family, response regulator